VSDKPPTENNSESWVESNSNSDRLKTSGRHHGSEASFTAKFPESKGRQGKPSEWTLGHMGRNVSRGLSTLSERRNKSTAAEREKAQ
jgi:hypothetical protein